MTRLIVAWASLCVAGCCAPARPVCGRVVDEDGRAVPGATVQAPGTASSVADAEGWFCLPAGRNVVLAASAPDHCAAEGVVPDEAGWAPIVLRRQLAVPSVWRAGFDAPVRLRAELRCPLPGPATFRWDQLEGPPLGDRADGWRSPVLTLRTHPLAARTQRPDVLSLSPAEAGHYRLRVTAEGGGRVVRAEAVVWSAAASAGLLSVPSDSEVFVDTGPDAAGGEWRLESFPPGSRARPAPVPTADGRPGVWSLRLDQPGLYALVETTTGTRLVFEAGPWDSVPRDCDRPECHPAEQAAWSATRHARALHARLEAPSTKGPFGDACLACHTVGWDPGGDNGGFDDVARETGTFVHDAWPGGATALPRDLERVANVWCLACHGPGRLPEHGKRPMVVRAGVCAQCHDRPPEDTRVAEWRESRMASPVADPALAAAPCAGCHTAQGAVARLRGRIVPDVPPGLAEPVTCAVCHVAHTTEPRLLRATGTAATVSGVLFEAGRARACLGCHQADGRADATAETGRRLPEAPQTEVLFGTGAFGATGRPWRPTPDLCVDCHMVRCLDCHADAERRRGGHTFQAMPPLDLAPQDCDGDGRVLRLADEVGSCLARLEAAVRAELDALPGCAGAVPGRDGRRLVPVGPAGERLPECEAEWLRPERTPLYRAAHDWALIARDGSAGAHNPPFAIAVLRAALRQLGR